VKKRKGWLVAIIFAAVVATDFYLFGASLFAFAWHVRHGFHKEAEGINFRVPLVCEEVDTILLNEVNFECGPSRIRRRDAWMTFNFRVESSDRPLVPIKEEFLRKIGEHYAGRRNTTLAGRAGFCLEYESEVDGMDPQNVFAHQERIDCSFGRDLHASFLGTANAANEFYEFMQTAQPVKRKN